MTLYEIDRAIAELLVECVDIETGEIILDLEAVEALQMEREAKLENIALYIKNLASEAAAIKEEEKALAERRKAKENKAERLKTYLSDALGGSAFETARVKCAFRKSAAVNITDNTTLLWYLQSMSLDKCVKHKEPEVVKSELAKLLKAGQEIPGAALEERNNMTIK